MQVKPERLAGVLARPAPPTFFFVWGEEPQQRVESVDAIRGAQRAGGVDERLVFDAVSGVDWSAIEIEAGSPSLFAAKRLIEIHLGARKPDRRAAGGLATLAGLSGTDVWLVTCEAALSRDEQTSAWYRALDARGAVVPCRPLVGSAFENWLAARARARGRTLTPEASAVLALRAEGNLLAAAQEIDKLALLVETTSVTAEQALAAVADSSRYDPFKLVDAALAGEIPRTVRILRGLRSEGVEPVVLSWLVNRELRLLLRLSEARSNLAAQLRAERVWKSRESLLRQALERLPHAALVALLRDGLRVDMVVKGAASGLAWEELETIYLALAGGPWLGELARSRGVR